MAKNAPRQEQEAPNPMDILRELYGMEPAEAKRIRAMMSQFVSGTSGRSRKKLTVLGHELKKTEVNQVLLALQQRDIMNSVLREGTGRRTDEGDLQRIVTLLSRQCDYEALITLHKRLEAHISGRKEDMLPIVIGNWDMTMIERLYRGLTDMILSDNKGFRAN